MIVQALVLALSREPEIEVVATAIMVQETVAAGRSYRMRGHQDPPPLTPEPAGNGRRRGGD